MSSVDCNFVSEYLSRFGQSRSAPDIDRVSDHVKRCRSCYERVAGFFQTLAPKKSEYLDATLDELSGAIYNLVKSLVRESTKDGRRTHETVRCVTEPGQRDEIVQLGNETIDDVQDYTGKDVVRGESLESIRSLILECDLNFARQLLQKGMDLAAKFSLDCANLKGILHIHEKEVDAAEECFRFVLSTRNADSYQRSVLLHSMSNMGYVYLMKERLDEAIRWVERAAATAEEWNAEEFNPLFTAMYFYLMRDNSGDRERCREVIRRLCGNPAKEAELQRVLMLETNQVIRELLQKCDLAAALPFGLN